MAWKNWHYSDRLNEHVANVTTHLSNSLEDRQGWHWEATCPKEGEMWPKDNVDPPGKTKGKPSPHFTPEQRELERPWLVTVCLNLNSIPLVTSKKHGDAS